MSLKKTLCIIALASSLAAPAMVVAQSVEDLPSEKVSYEDLNLNSKAGVARLMHRLQSAASAVCGGEPTTLEMVRDKWFLACQRRAMAGAVQQIDSSRVTAMFQGQTPNVQVAKTGEPDQRR